MSLLYSGPSLAVPHEEYAARGRVDPGAQLTSSSRLVVDAPADRVWAVPGAHAPSQPRAVAF